MDQINNETIYYNAFENNFTGYLVLDPKGNILKVNKKISKILDYTEGQLLKTNIIDLSHKEDMELIHQFILKSLVKTESKASKLECRFLSRKDIVIWFEILVSRIENNGKTNTFLANFTDITLRKSYEDRWLKYEFIVNNSKERMSLIDREYRLVAVNNSYCKASGKEREELQNRKLIDIWGKKRFNKFIKKKLDLCFQGNEIHDFDWFDFGNNDRHCFEIVYYPYHNSINQITHTLVVSRDVTESKRAEEALQKSEEQFRSLFENSLDTIYLTTNDMIILDINDAGLKLLGYKRDEIIGMELNKLFYNSDDWENVEKSLLSTGQVKGYALEMKKKNSTMIQCLLTKSPRKNKDGNINGYQGIIKDITDLKQTEKRLHHMAYHDSLTGLPNRSLFSDRLNHAILNAERYGKKLAILLFDLDNFKNVNDTFGHPIGDELLKAVASRIKRVIRKSDTFARLSGDEFALIINDFFSNEQLIAVIKKILQEVSEPAVIKNYEIITTCSIGISIYPQDGKNEETLIKKTDIAMYYAKSLGKNEFQFFSDEINIKTKEQMDMVVELRRAIEQKELLLHYQPQFDCSNKKIEGVEALLRWDSKRFGFIHPIDFIPLAEESGLIVPIGEWVLTEACHQLKEWENEGIQDIVMSVNISAVQFRQKNIFERIESIVRLSQINPENLEIEITESIIMSDIERTINTLNKLKNLGIKVAIDDFGTGYSSLNYLKRFPLNTLKIDKNFIIDLEKDSENKSIVTAIISLGHDLGLNIVAEGIESLDHLDFLNEKKCNKGQGFYFSKPIQASDIKNMLK